MLVLGFIFWIFVVDTSATSKTLLVNLVLLVTECIINFLAVFLIKETKSKNNHIHNHICP